ncbi:putative internal virion protein C [Pseudomonas phage Ep4]|uniref:Internal virion protein C n=1 Tax=Pseudomonas phage Ep4 TaxID=3057492 RepID=A0AAU9ELL4_9CAUD|nr:putative internal virion protein C [Pseudomonas phage Ep4]
MSTIRKRPDEDLTVPGAISPVMAGGVIEADNNPLLAPGTADTSALRIAPTSSSESATAALRETIAAKALRGWNYSDIPAEDGFDPTKAIGPKAAQYTEDELEFLGDARSTAELNQRLGQVTTTRQSYADMGANPVAAVAASLFDVDAVIGLGLGKAVGLARTTRLIAGLTANTAVLGLASEGGHLTPLEIIGSSLGAALGALPRTVRAVRAVDDVAEAAPAVRAADVADQAVPPVRTPEAAPSTVPDVPKVRVPDPDYVPPKPDMTTPRPYMEVVRGNGRDVIQTDTHNLVRGVLDLSTDLPAGVRALGEALSEALAKEGGMPLVVRTETRGGLRSSANLKANGAMEVELYHKAGAKATLTETIQAMTPYERTIALHEAAHAKTLANMSAFSRGTLADGPAKDAIARLDSIRESVRAVIDRKTFPGIDNANWRNNVEYGLAKREEFVAQLFNSPDFRQVLQSVRMQGESVWSELVRKVVQAFTGKLPGNTAFEHTVGAFEELLKLPSDPRIGNRAAKVVPDIQSDVVAHSPTPGGMLDAMGKAINRNFALYDNIKQIGAKAAVLADQLVVDATSSTANSATHYARSAHLAANVAAAQVDSAIKQAMTAKGWGVMSRLRNPTRYREAYREFSSSVYAQLAENHARHLEGSAIVRHADANVENVVENFAKSRWAEGQLERVKASGMQGADGIEASPYYLPRRHSADKIGRFLRDNPNVTRADIEGMYASQFAKMFAQKGMTPETASSLGKQMFRNMEQRASGVSGYRQHIAGMTGDDIEFAMRNAGIEDAKIAQFLDVANRAGADANTVKNLRSRASFEMTADYVTKSGRTIQPQMFVDQDVLGLMEGYSRTMSGRIGLAKAGFPDVKSLAAAVDDAASEAPDIRKAKETLDNTVNQILGYPTGENVPDILRSFSVASGAVQLASSGIYQLADATLMIKEFGITKVMKSLASTQWGRSGLELAQHPEFGSRLRDILEARNVLSGRYRTLMTHLEDNTDIGTLGISHQVIQQVGQGTRFANGMEYVRRAQSKVVAGLVGDTVDSAIRGDAAAAAQMTRFGLNPDLLERAKVAFRNDPDLREWPSSLRLDMETVAQNVADAMVQENRLGEIPAWMQFSTLGKFVLPYMRFVAGTWNKILRRTYAQDGAKGVAMMFAYQLPLTTLSSVVALAQAPGNKPITAQTVTANVLTQMPLMSWMGYAVNMAVQGPTNSIAALGLVDKAYGATKSIISGDPDPSQIVRAVPFLSIIPGIRIMANAMAEED